MPLFNFSRKSKSEPLDQDTVKLKPNEVKRCAFDTTIGKKPLWVIKTSENKWTADEKAYKEEKQAYFQGIKVGTADNAGYTITNLLSRSDEYVIYEVQNPSGEYSIRIDIQTLVEEDDLPMDRWSEVAREYYITKRVLFKVNDNSVRQRIANIVSRALSTGYTSEAVQDLKDLQIDINNIYREKIQNSLKYLGTIICITLLFVMFSLCIYAGGCFLNQENIRLLIFSSTAGCIGGFFSVSIRLRKMSFEREIPGITYVLYGFERMIISICGAIIALLAIKGGIAFEFAKSSIFTILLVSVAAGFSETLIPNLLVKIETENK